MQYTDMDLANAEFFLALCAAKDRANSMPENDNFWSRQESGHPYGDVRNIIAECAITCYGADVTYKLMNGLSYFYELDAEGWLRLVDWAKRELLAEEIAVFENRIANLGFTLPSWDVENNGEGSPVSVLVIHRTGEC